LSTTRPHPEAPRLPRALSGLALLCAALVPLLAPARGAAETTPPPRPTQAETAPAPETEPGTAPETAAGTEPEAEARAAAEADLFAMPAIAEQTRAAFGRIEAGDPAAAREILDALARDHPRIGLTQANRAAFLALEGETEAAIAALGEAAARGYDGIAALTADPLFAGIAEDPRVRALVAAEAPALAPGGGFAPPFGTAPAPDPAPRPRPPLALAPVTEGVALVSGANTRWDPVAERLRTGFAFPARAEGAVVPDRKTAATDLLREHYKRGRAAGNLGDLYDNRDRGHSALPEKDHPQLAHTVYSDAARAAGLDYGANDLFLYDAPTLGNSSTAITGGALWRSLPRLALTRADGTGPLRLWQDATANLTYVYPAHKDYGPGTDAGGGDLFPANTPYLLVSHGSSGSDQPFLEAVAMIYAAYRPETKARLAREGLIVPTTQMVFRRSLQTVRSRADYFGPAAHPAAFEAYDINLARMVSLANSITEETIPPQVRIRVTAEDLGTEGLDYFGTGLSEQLFDTPAAIARIWRSRAFTREITLDAGETTDPNGRPLTFAWRLIAGDPDKVRITPSEDGRSATVSLDWHEPFPISKDNPIPTHRVDIGVFANNGAHDSAPAILSVYFPPEEARVYETGPDGAERIASIDYQGHPAAYADPMLLPRADWRDDYHYAADGAPRGWTRRRSGGAAEEFDARGFRIPPGGAGAPERVSYPLSLDAEGALLLGESPAPFATEPGSPPGPPPAP
jgi:hypothetical protein